MPKQQKPKRKRLSSVGDRQKVILRLIGEVCDKQGIPLEVGWRVWQHQWKFIRERINQGHPDSYESYLNAYIPRIGRISVSLHRFNIYLAKIIEIRNHMAPRNRKSFIDRTGYVPIQKGEFDHIDGRFE